jgi:cell wall-associated NlpC family hydrolase
MFFGDRGPSSSPSQNFHAGVYMGNGWFIHSSGGNGGVAINALDGWWGEHFSWGRRALRTA